MSAITYRGEDKRQDFTIKDDAGNLIDLTGFSGIIAYLVSESDGVIGWYSREAYTNSSGRVFDTADFEQANQVTNKGEFTIRVQSDITKAASISFYYWDIKVQTDDTDYDDNTFDTLARVSVDDNNDRFVFKDTFTKNDFTYG